MSPNAEQDAGRAEIIPKFGIAARLRTYFLAGILVTAPVSITFAIAWKVISVVDAQVSPLIPPGLIPQDWALPGIGLLIVVVSLTLLGFLTANFAGRLMVRLFDGILGRMPVIRGVHGAVKQIFHTVLASKADAFREVVLVEYPRAGVWTLGFITGSTGGRIGAVFEEEMVTVFVPTSPNPTSGFILFARRAELRPLEVSVEEGLKMVVSTGILTP